MTSRSRHQRTISSDIYTTCRALQGRLSSNISHSPLRTFCVPTLLPSPTLNTGAKMFHTKSSGPKSSSKSQHTGSVAQQTLQIPPRGARKRRRSISDHESHDSVRENTDHAPLTPKRQRIAPPSLPLGLVPQDFDNLSCTPATDTVLVNRPSNSPTTPVAKATTHLKAQSTALSPSTYSSALVSLIVEKFSLREKVLGDLQSTTGGLDDRWRSVMAAAEMARSRNVRREMVIRRGGKRERKSLEGIW